MESLVAMSKQEAKVYRVEAATGERRTATCSCGGRQQDEDDDRRSRVASWCFQMVDYCGFHRETVEIAMNMLDRWTQAKKGLVGRRRYQLAGITCLYIAAKVHEPLQHVTTLSITSLSVEWAHHAYQPFEFGQMEQDILQTLQWRVNPPTALAFVRENMDQLVASESIPEILGGEDRLMYRALHELTKYQTELATTLVDLMHVPSATIAMACLLNALRSLGLSTSEARRIHRELMVGANATTESTASSSDDLDTYLLRVQTQLFEAVIQQQHMQEENLNDAPLRRKMGVIVPVLGGIRMERPSSGNATSRADINKGRQRSSSCKMQEPPTSKRRLVSVLGQSTNHHDRADNHQQALPTTITSQQRSTKKLPRESSSPQSTMLSLVASALLQDFNRSVGMTS